MTEVFCLQTQHSSKLNQLKCATLFEYNNISFFIIAKNVFFVLFFAIIKIRDVRSAAQGPNVAFSLINSCWHTLPEIILVISFLHEGYNSLNSWVGYLS